MTHSVKPLPMYEFRAYLQEEYLARSARNKSYSLRAFAKQIGLHHATLSTLLSGKRKMTRRSVAKIARNMELSSEEKKKFLSEEKRQAGSAYVMLPQAAFAAMAEWYFDAILELAKIPSFRMEAAVIAPALAISTVEAQYALDTLHRLGLWKPHGKAKPVDTTNSLDPDKTSAAQLKYQRSVLEKSLAALGTIEKSKRTHSSTTIAIDVKDLAKAKEMIRGFRHELDKFLQRKSSMPNEVYQLQMSFFPLTQLGETK